MLQVRRDICPAHELSGFEAGLRAGDRAVCVAFSAIVVPWSFVGPLIRQRADLGFPNFAEDEIVASCVVWGWDPERDRVVAGAGVHALTFAH